MNGDDEQNPEVEDDDEKKEGEESDDADQKDGSGSSSGSSKSSQAKEDEEDEAEVDPAMDKKNWKSSLIKGGYGSFLQPDRLLEKVKLAMSRYGIKHAEPDCYGLLVDQSEEMMKNIVSDLISTCRTRLQDGQPNML